jgi:hypothetical protein
MQQPILFAVFAISALLVVISIIKYMFCSTASDRHDDTSCKEQHIEESSIPNNAICTENQPRTNDHSIEI